MGAEPDREGGDLAEARLALLIDGYVDGTLAPAAAAELAGVLRGGGADATVVRNELAWRGLLAQALDGADAADLRRSLLERLAAESGAQDFARRVRRALPAGAVRPRRRRGGAASAVRPLIALAVAAGIAVIVALASGLPRPAPACRLAGPAQATVLRAGRSLVLDAGAGLLDEDVVESPRGAALRFADGTRIDLAGGGRLRLLAGDGDGGGGGGDGKRLRLEHGTLDAEVSPQPSGRPLRVLTAEATIEVLGTNLVVVSAPGSTRVDLLRGSVRVRRDADQQVLDLRAGETATVADGSTFAARPLGAPPRPASTAEPAWRALSTSDLDAWRIRRGRWLVEDGVLVGDDPAGGTCRIESVESFGDFSLACQLRADQGMRLIEVQFHDYARFFSRELDHGDAWRTLSVEVRGGTCTATIDGEPMRLERGMGDQTGGPIAFYGRTPGRLQLRAVRVRGSLPTPITPGHPP